MDHQRVSESTLDGKSLNREFLNPTMFEQLILDFIARTYRDAAHSVFSPSGSGMWGTCPGSLIPNLLSPDTAGIDAAEGTVAHGIHEEWLKTGEKPSHLLGKTEVVREGRESFEITIDESMFDYVQESVDRLMYLPGVQYVEQKVYFSRLTPIPKQGGTADFFCCEPGKLNITDYKHGKGVQVYAENNSQALLYALGVFYKYDWLFDFQEINIGIHQPRLDHFDYWQTDRKSLLKFARHIKARAADAWRLNAPLVASEKACRFCKVKAQCPAFLKMAEDMTDQVFSDVYEVTNDEVKPVLDDLRTGLFEPKLELPELLSTSDMARLIPFRGSFESWFSAMETELERRALDGESVPGRKLVEARTNREFIDEKSAITKMDEQGVHWTKLFSTKMMSPSQCEDLLRLTGMRKADAVQYLASVVRKPPGKPVLVPDSDKRPAYVAPDEDVWNDL